MRALGSKRELAASHLDKLPELAGQYHTKVVDGFWNRSTVAVLLVFSFFAWLNALAIPYAQSQSTDQPHIVPRKPAAPVSPPSTSEPLDGDAALNVQMRHLRVGVNLVLVPVAVTDAASRPITNLQKSDFTVYEGNEKQEIQSFSVEPDPISVGVILDVSKSMSNKINTEREAVSEFFKNANPQDDYFVITLSDRPRLVADTTQSLDEIEEKLSYVIPDGNTALLDGIYVGVNKLRTARYKRRALLVISDGGDNHSHYNAKETKSLVQEADVLVYSIGLIDNMPVPVFKTIEEKLGKRLLTEITDATGGRTIVADNRTKVADIAATISRELREQYVLGYRPSNGLHDGKWRKIKVRVTASTGDPTLRAYYKRGYYAPEE
jgi:Ca-activated chloride channel family protein